MASTRRRRSARAGRAPMYSPGRPPVARRDHRQRFWEAIAAGASSEDAGRLASVSPAVGGRWFREGGGMPTIKLAALSGRYLSFSEREEIALLRAKEWGVRRIARRLGRSPSTISRELRRNAATRSGGLEYRATTAQWHADRLDVHEDRSRQSLPATKRCGPGSKNALLGRYVRRMVDRSLGPACRRGTAGDTGGARTVDGRKPGALSRLRGGCRLNFRMTKPCVFRTKPSTSRCMCRGAEHSVASWSPVFAPAER